MDINNPPLTNRLTIGEASKQIDVSIKTLRRWHAEGLVHCLRNSKNQRLFDPSELQAIKNNRLNTNPYLTIHYYTISEASNLLGVSIKTLRRWEKAGRIISSRNSLNQRVYTRDEVQRTKRHQSLEKINPLTSPAYLHHPFRASIFKSFLYSAALLGVVANAIMITAYPKFNIPSIDSELTSLTTNQLKLATAYRSAPSNGSLLQKTQNVSVDAPPAHPNNFSESISNIDILNNNNAKNKQQNGTNNITVGQSQTIITTSFLTPESTIIVTFEKDYSPATRYWITKELSSFTVHLDQPAVTTLPFSYLIIY
jgi:DNA-binding transcriptional MerR regulator